MRRACGRSSASPWCTSTRSSITLPVAGWANGPRRAPVPTAPWSWPSPQPALTTEGLNDTEYVAERTVGFDRWKAYILGEDDGVPRAPAVAGERDRYSARDVKALARDWGGKKTLPVARGFVVFGGACRTATAPNTGAGHGVSHGHAGPGQAGGQHGLPAAGHSGGDPLKHTPHCSQQKKKKKRGVRGALGGAVVLHARRFSDLHVAVAVGVRRAGRTAGYLRAMVIEDSQAGPQSRYHPRTRSYRRRRSASERVDLDLVEPDRCGLVVFRKDR